MHSASVNNNPGVAVFPAAQCTGVAMVAQERHLVSTPSILGARQHNPGIFVGEFASHVFLSAVVRQIGDPICRNLNAAVTRGIRILWRAFPIHDEFVGAWHEVQLYAIATCNPGL